MESYGTEEFVDRACKYCSSFGSREYADRNDNVNWIIYVCPKCSVVKYKQFITDEVYRERIKDSLAAHKRVYGHVCSLPIA